MNDSVNKSRATTPTPEPVYRTAEVLVDCLRGTSGGHAGFWIIQRCAAENLDSIHFVSARRTNLVPSGEEAASSIFSFDDLKRTGISGRGGKARLIGRDADHAAYSVTAVVSEYR